MTSLFCYDDMQLRAVVRDADVWALVRGDLAPVVRDRRGAGNRHPREAGLAHRARRLHAGDLRERGDPGLGGVRTSPSCSAGPSGSTISGRAASRPRADPARRARLKHAPGRPITQHPPDLERSARADPRAAGRRGLHPRLSVDRAPAAPAGGPHAPSAGAAGGRVALPDGRRRISAVFDRAPGAGARPGGARGAGVASGPCSW